MEKAQKSLNYEPLDKDIVDEIMSSLNEDFRDYAFNLKTYKEVIQRCHQKKISIIYTIHYDRYNELDYIEFIPVHFKKTPTIKRKTSVKLANLQVNMAEIKEDKNNWEWVDKSKFKTIKIAKNREASNNSVTKK